MTYSSQFVPWSKNINSGVSFAVLAAGDQALVSFDVLIHIFAFLGYCGYCGYCVSDPRTFHQIFVNPEIDMRYKLNKSQMFFFGGPKFDVSPHSLLHQERQGTNLHGRWKVIAQQAPAQPAQPAQATPDVRGSAVPRTRTIRPQLPVT